MHNDLLGRKQFNTVVHLKTQVRVTHPEWLEVLQHVRHGNCDKRHIVMLHQFIVTHNDCPPTNFTTPPWKDVLLVTLRHVVWMKWNSMTTRMHTQALGITLIIWYCAGMPINIRGEIHRQKHSVWSAVGPARKSQSPDKSYPLLRFTIVLRMMSTSSMAIAQLESSGMDWTSKIIINFKCRAIVYIQRFYYDIMPDDSVWLWWLSSTCHLAMVLTPITPAYAFTNYHSQAQTIEHRIMDLASQGKLLTPVEAIPMYVEELLLLLTCYGGVHKLRW